MAYKHQFTKFFGTTYDLVNNVFSVMGTLQYSTFFSISINLMKKFSALSFRMRYFIREADHEPTPPPFY